MCWQQRGSSSLPQGMILATDFLKKRMKKLFIPLSLVGLVLGGVACEREWREVGGRPSGEQVQVAAASAVQADRSLAPKLAHVAAVAPSGAAPNGEALYAQVCVACHQISGQGIPGAFPPLDGSPYVVSDDTARMAAIMIYGLQGPIEVKGMTYNSVMAPLGHLKNEELAAIATYVRSAWSNQAGPVEASVFSEVRQKYGSRGPFTIADLGAEN